MRATRLSEGYAFDADSFVSTLDDSTFEAHDQLVHELRIALHHGISLQDISNRIFEAGYVITYTQLRRRLREIGISYRIDVSKVVSDWRVDEVSEWVMQNSNVTKREIRRHFNLADHELSRVKLPKTRVERLHVDQVRVAYLAEQAQSIQSIESSVAKGEYTKKVFDACRKVRRETSSSDICATMNMSWMGIALLFGFRDFDGPKNQRYSSQDIIDSVRRYTEECRSTSLSISKYSIWASQNNGVPKDAVLSRIRWLEILYYVQFGPYKTFATS